MGKPKGRRPLRKPRHIFEDNIEMDFVEAGWCGMVWVHRFIWLRIKNTGGLL
jgi:hypothetical protein